MYTKIKFLVRLLLAIVIFTFSSCEKDLYEEAIQQNHNELKNHNIPNIIEKSFEELILDKKFKNAYYKISKAKTNSSFSKTVMEANYNFTISNFSAKVIEINNKISYTFHITRDFSDSDSFENLVISVDSSNQVKAYIAKYKNVKSLNSSKNKIPFRSVKYHSIIYNSRPTFKVTDCVTFTYSLCNGDPYDCGGSICGFGELTVCDGSSGEIDNGSGTLWGGGDTSGSTGTVTTPVGGSGSYNPLTATNAQKFFYSFDKVGFERPLLTAMSLEASGILSNYLNSNPYPSTNSSAAKTFITNLTQYGDWFTNQSVATQTGIFNYLIPNNFSSESRSFVSEIINLSINEPNQLDAINLVDIILKLDTNSTNIFEDDFALTLDPYVDLDLNSLNTPPSTITPNLFVLHTYMKYRLLRQMNTTWSKAKCAWEASKEIIHISLDAFGLIPVGGEVADLINGALYTIEGDGLNATLSYASAVPVAGWAAVGVKYAVKIKTVATIGTKVKLTWKVLADGTIYFGSNNTCRAQLRKVLGLAVGNLNQAHHIIPLNLQTNPIVQNAAKSGNAFHLNEALNGIPLITAVHSGSHAHYDGLILDKLILFEKTNPNATPSQCYTKINEIISQIRTAIANNPNTPINQLNF